MGGRFTIFGRCAGCSSTPERPRTTAREAYRVVSVPGNIQTLASESLELDRPGTSKSLNVCAMIFDHKFKLLLHSLITVIPWCVRPNNIPLRLLPLMSKLTKGLH